MVCIHKSQHGQAVAEALFALLILMTTGIALCRAAFYASARETLRFVGREALVCMLEIDQLLPCEHEAQLALSQAFGWSRPWIKLAGEHRQRKVVLASFRPERPTGQVETLKQTTTLKEFLK